MRRLVARVEAIDAVLSEDRSVLLVAVAGRVPGTGWTEGALVERPGGRDEGLLELDFVAQGPARTGAGMLPAYALGRFSGHLAALRTVRVHAEEGARELAMDDVRVRRGPVTDAAGNPTPTVFGLSPLSIRDEPLTLRDLQGLRVRVVAPDERVTFSGDPQRGTLDADPRRVNVHVDGLGKVRDVTCG